MDKNIKIAIKNMNTYLDECHDDGDTVVITAKVLRSIRDNYCELLRYKETVERLNKEVERLSQVVLYNDGVTKMLISEARKEFWEKLKEKRYGGTYPYVLITEGDNLLKEMEGA